MKKTMKKLALSKETVMELSGPVLEGVVAGEFTSGPGGGGVMEPITK